MLRLETLGGLTLASDSSELAGAALQKRRLALLAALAVAGAKGLSRQQVLALLWTDTDETRGRQALSQSLYALKKDTGEDDLIVGSDVLRLNPNVITSDVAEFEAAIDGRRLDDAVTIYTGSFLDGVYVSDSDDFDRWADLERARLGRAAERAIEELAARADGSGDHRTAAELWRRLVAIDPLKTRANLGLMSALAASGERVNALKQFDAYARRLRDDLDVEPGDAARALAEKLRHEGDGAAIGDRFVVERELGRGGMAVVFLARDRKHDRPVAVKMLHPELGAAVGRERLAREILVTARLQHPHILPLHDSGEHGGTLYYVMPFVEGESLRDRLARERQLAIPDALRIAREVADALDYAHRRAVVHRDIKPENVLLAEAHAFVADFGIASVVSDALDPTLTHQGSALGTPAYMSPEQVAGERDVGPASDLFSLGCVLFEMLTGRPPWIAANVQALLAKRFTERAPSIRATRPDVPAWLDDVVRQLLVADPAHRLSSAAELVRLLNDSSRPAPSRLPAPPDELIGRDRETAAATELLTHDSIRLLTFTGAGGSGKTRLALQVAARCEPHFEAAYLVDLTAVSDPAGVEAAIADVLDVRAPEGSDLLTALASHIATSHALLVLDNFEQVVSAAARIVRLIATCPALAVLVTSRVRLGVRGEHEFFVAPLGVTGDESRAAPAVELFVRRAREARPDLSFDDDSLAAITAICTRLDGLPLAIELAAARSRVMTIRQILARLDRGFELLAGGARDMPARHQTMRQTIEWSYGLLTPAHQDLFARVAVFAGGCTLAAAEQVCDDGALGVDVLAGVETLLDASLLMRVDPRDGAEPRLRMLETVREFALDRLGDRSDVLHRLRIRHCAWALSFARERAPELIGPGQRDALAALAAEHPNIVLALERTIAAGDAHSALGIAAAVWRYWLVRRGLEEGRELIERALAMPAPPDAEQLRADAMLGAGQLAQNHGDIEKASRYFNEVLAIRRRAGDRRGEARALADLSWLDWRRCSFENARRLATECLTLAREIDDEQIAALALGNLGFTAHCEGRLGEAREAFTVASAIRERCADRRGTAFIRTALAWTLSRGNQLAEARTFANQAVAIQHELRDERLEAFALNVLVEIELRCGNVAAARALLAQTLPTARRIGDRWTVAHGLCLMCRADILDAALDAARARVMESLDIRRAIGDHYGVAESLFTVSEIDRLEGRVEAAGERLRESREIRASIGDRLGAAECDASLLALARAGVLT